MTEEGLCSAITRIDIFYEYHPHNLRKDLEEMKGRNIRYDEIEIVTFIIQIVFK